MKQRGSLNPQRGFSTFFGRFECRRGLSGRTCGLAWLRETQRRDGAQGFKYSAIFAARKTARSFFPLLETVELVFRLQVWTKCGENVLSIYLFDITFDLLTSW